MNARARRGLSWGVPVALLLALVLFVLQGANRPADPSFHPGTVPVGSDAATADPAGDTRVPVPGFGEISFRIDATGLLFGGRQSVSAVRCALLADTAAQHSQGLMGRTDLSGYDGMIFRFPADTQTPFFMKDTLIPLSIAWFDADATFVDSADMPPCGDAPVCPTYGPNAPYRFALEVPQGELAALGVGPEARLILGAERC